MHPRTRLRLPVSARRCWAALALACAVVPAKSAGFPPTSPERYVAVVGQGTPARARLFELQRMAVPVCHREVLWTLGEGAFPVAAAAPENEAMRALRTQVMGEFGAEAGDTVFLTDGIGPYGAAGARRGDRLLPAADRLTELPVAAAGSVAVLDGAAPAATFRERVIARSTELAAEPERRTVLRRDGNDIAVTVKAVPICPVGFAAVDSKYSYADAWGNAVYVTLPLISGLGDAELTMVLAHELSLLIVKKERDHSVAGSIFRALILPRPLLVMAENRELKILPLDDDTLIDVDRMTLWLLRGYGIRPRQYREFLQKMSSREAVLDVASYVRTRPLRPRREAALREAEATDSRNATLPIPQDLDIAKLREVFDSARAVLPAGRAGGSAANPVRAVAFAAKPDFDRAPFGTRGMERLQHYRTLPSPKAFFVFDDSRWRFWSAVSNPVERGFAFCEREGTKCWLYAVDDDIVWQEDPTRRVGNAADWNERAARR